MMPNIDPRQLKSMMDKMGISSREIPATRVVIESRGGNIVIDNPQVVEISAQGSKSYQISGIIREEAGEEEKVEIRGDDVRVVMEQSGADEATARKALESTNGDIAAAILKIEEEEPVD
ncbi:MAG: nascent polypeptide-associated complex protein [Candidatus Micrarchaeota archaeon]|nr:nascent polypeptide-associated complex protein [Candidatus Micrarchaeota archaeon]